MIYGLNTLATMGRYLLDRWGVRRSPQYRQNLSNVISRYHATEIFREGSTGARPSPRSRRPEAPALARPSQVDPENAGPPGGVSCREDVAASRSGRRLDPWLIPAAALALIPILTLAQPGLPRTADGFVHLLRSLEVRGLLAAGVFYPSWAPHFYLGYGYPFFDFYAPGAHLLAGLAALTGLGVLRGVLVVQILALLLIRPAPISPAVRSSPGSPLRIPRAPPRC